MSSINERLRKVIGSPKHVVPLVDRLQSELSKLGLTLDQILDDSMLEITEVPTMDLMEESEISELKIVQGPMKFSPENRYERISLLGKGGFSHVWRVRDTFLHRTLVSKNATHLNEQNRLLFIREAQICAQLQHPGICPLYDFIEQKEGEYNLLMKEIRGLELSKAIAQLPHQTSGIVNSDLLNTSIFTIVEQFIQVCNTIAYAHSKGVAHLDLKPRNIMLGEYGEILIIDWGIARSIRPVRKISSDESPVFFDPKIERILTLGNAGTVLYAPIEQLNGVVDHRCDIFSLGMILIRILSKMELPTSQPEELVRLKATGELRIMPKEDSTYFKWLKDQIYHFDLLYTIAQKATELNPDDRYQSALEMVKDLKLWTSGSGRRSNANKHLSAIKTLTETVLVLQDQLYTLHTKVDEPLRSYYEILKLNNQLNAIHFQRRANYQKAIFFLVEDRKLIKEFVEIQLLDFWASKKRHDWALSERILVQLQLYVDLLSEEQQTDIAQQLQKLQSSKLFKQPTMSIPRPSMQSDFEQLFEQHTHVLITGPAGTGKTHLTKDKCAEWLFQGIEFCFVDLQLCKRPIDIRYQLQNELGIGGMGIPSTTEIIHFIRSNGPAYLILDNCEQLTQSAQKDLNLLLQQIPDVQVILTSRKKHNFSTPVVYEIPNMSVLEAMHMFVCHLTGEQRDSISDDELQNIHDLVCALSCVPLTIELLSHRVRNIPIVEMLSHLENRFELLVNNIQEGKGSSLWATLEWSWNLLSPAAKMTLCQCSLFAGSFSQKDFISIFQEVSSLNYLNALNELERLHLIGSDVLDSERWYSVLPSIQQYAMTHLESLSEFEQESYNNLFSKFYADFYENVDDWEERNKRMPQMLRVLQFERVEYAYQLKTLSCIFDTNIEYGPCDRAISSIKLLKGRTTHWREELKVLKLYNILGQRLLLPIPKQMENFRRMDALQHYAETEPNIWIDLQLLRLKFYISFGSTEPIVVSRLMSQVKEQISALNLDEQFSPDEKNKILNYYVNALCSYHISYEKSYRSAIMGFTEDLCTTESQELKRLLTIGHFHMELGEYSVADEYFLQCIKRTEANGKSNLIQHLYVRGLLKIHQKQFTEAKSILDKAIGLSKKANELRSLQNMENLRRYIDFEVEGVPINFEISANLTSVYNYMLFHAYQHNNRRFFLALRFMNNNAMYPSSSLNKFIIEQISRFTIQLRNKEDYPRCIEALENTVVLGDENPIFHAQQQQILGEMYIELDNPLTATQHFEIARHFLPEEKAQFRTVLQIEILYGRLLNDELIVETDLEYLEWEMVTYTEHSMVMKASAALCVLWNALKNKRGLMKELDNLTKLSKRFPLTQDVIDRMSSIRLQSARKQIDELIVSNRLVSFNLEEVLPKIQ